MNTITPRPIYPADHIDQSRDISGFNKWSRSSRTVDFILSFLGWFTIPTEVFLRRDFGQRWFTTVNYYAGLFLLLILTIIQYIIVVVVDFFRNLIEEFVSSVNPFHEGEEYYIEDSLMDHSMLLVLLAYLLMGAYHLFKIWWRNRTNTALHSFCDGTSRLEPIGGGIMQVVNIITTPLVRLGIRLVPKQQRVEIPLPDLISDRSAFTNTVIEPLLLFFLAVKCSGIISFWLFVSAIALIIHANWRETAKLNKILDFRDSIHDARAMRQLHSETQSGRQNEMMQQMAETLRDEPQVSSRLTEQYPDLMDIIEDLNKDKKQRQSA